MAELEQDYSEEKKLDRAKWALQKIACGQKSNGVRLPRIDMVESARHVCILFGWPFDMLTVLKRGSPMPYEKLDASNHQAASFAAQCEILEIEAAEYAAAGLPYTQMASIWTSSLVHTVRSLKLLTDAELAHGLREFAALIDAGEKLIEFHGDEPDGEIVGP